MDLDDVIANPQYQICHSRVARAPLVAVWDALHRVTMRLSPWGMRSRAYASCLPGSPARSSSPSPATPLDVTPIPVLFSERPHVVISAGLSQAWRLLGGSIPPHLDAAALRAWSQPGWIKAGMEFRLEPVSAGTLLSTETRVVATDPKTRRAFAAYWFVIPPASSAIRREVLKVVARRAESSLKAR